MYRSFSTLQKSDDLIAAPPPVGFGRRRLHRLSSPPILSYPSHTLPSPAPCRVTVDMLFQLPPIQHRTHWPSHRPRSTLLSPFRVIPVITQNRQQRQMYCPCESCCWSLNGHQKRSYTSITYSTVFKSISSRASAHVLAYTPYLQAPSSPITPHLYRPSYRRTSHFRVPNFL